MATDLAHALDADRSPYQSVSSPDEARGSPHRTIDAEGRRAAAVARSTVGSDDVPG